MSLAELLKRNNVPDLRQGDILSHRGKPEIEFLGALIVISFKGESSYVIENMEVRWHNDSYIFIW